MIGNGRMTVAQIATNESGGMCYAIHLKDGSFIIIDGGQADIDGADSYDDNSQALMDYIRSMSDDAKPVISAWFITHFHLDHVDMATRFIEEQKENFDIKLFAYNSPGKYENISEDERFANWENALGLYPNALRRVLKTGETYDFAGASVRVLMAEDFRYYKDPPSQNHISAAFMISFENGRKFAVLGDCDTERLHQLMITDSSVYQPLDNLKCDLLQVPHHGLPMGSKAFIDKNLELYKIMNPKICFFPVDEERYSTDAKFFDNPFYSDNYYLLTTRKEKCYHNSKTVVVDVSDLSIVN